MILQEAFTRFQKGYNIYTKLENLIKQHISDLSWARIKFRLKRYGWLIPLIISAIIGGVFSCEWLKNIIQNTH